MSLRTEWSADAGMRGLLGRSSQSENATRAFGGGALHFSDQPSLVAHLKTIANKDTTLLIKGSRSAAMDLVVRELCDSAGDLH